MKTLMLLTAGAFVHASLTNTPSPAPPAAGKTFETARKSGSGGRKTGGGRGGGRKKGVVGSWAADS